jgi:PelA/Pel-15E family pectate lyase
MEMQAVLRNCLCCFLMLTSTTYGQSVSREQKDLRKAATESLKKACQYYHDHVAVLGGYPYYCAADLTSRWGENELLRNAVVVQPPGTPTVGMAMLHAYQATGDADYLRWAHEAAGCLIQGQLQSGGWSQVIYFEEPNNKRMGKYRARLGGEWNNSSLDDDQTQAALRFMIEVDKNLKQKDQELHEGIAFGLNALLAAQFKNGGFPQVWSQAASDQPIVRATYPPYDWRSEGRLKNYWDYYTLNDGLASDVVEVLVSAHQVYGDEKYESALKRLGDFLLLAQMPEPQPGWCQQYNYAMQPIWARKFEPPAISGHESQDAMFALLRIAEVTGELRYIEPLPRAIEYLRNKCLQADGRLARFYELQTNQPLYMNRSYELTYDDSDLPSHYGWKQASRLTEIEQAYQQLVSGGKRTPRWNRPNIPDIERIIQEIDEQGRWLDRAGKEKLAGSPKFKPGEAYLSSARFSQNVKTISEFLRSSNDGD